MYNYRQFSVLRKTIDSRPLLQKHEHIMKISGRFLFWERDRKGGYNTKIKTSPLENIKNGFRELKYELKLFQKEVKDYFTMDPLLLARPGKIQLHITVLFF